MKQIVWLVGIMVLSQITGCAILRTPAGNADERIDSWLSQQEYDKALAFVAEWKESPTLANGNRQQIQEKITTHIASYEQRVVTKADQAATSNDWGTAFDGYREGLSRLPDSETLQQGQQQLVQRYTEHLYRLEMERLIAKGEWTLRELEVSKVAAANSSRDWFGQYVLRTKFTHANDVALELAEGGKRALERQDLNLAERLLSSARRLSTAIENRAGSPHLQDTLREEELRLRNEQQRSAGVPRAAQGTRSEQPDESERPAVKSQEQKRAKRLLADFRKACREKNLVEAQQLRSQLEELGVNNGEFEKLSKQLTNDSARHVKHLIEIGAAHYSQQQYEKAMNVWKEAQALDPTNEQLSARIKRVTRVLDKLQTLREKSAPAP